METNEEKINAEKKDMQLSCHNLIVLFLCVISLITYLINDTLRLDSTTFRSKENLNNVPLIVSSLTSILSLGFILHYYYLLSLEIQLRWGYPNRLVALMNSKIKYQFIIEFFLFFLSPYPHWDTTHSIGGFTWGLPFEMMIFIIFLRFCLIAIRTGRDHSILFRERHHFYEENQGSFQPTAGVSSKSIFLLFYARYSFKLLLFMYVFIWLMGSFVIWLCERDVYLPTSSNSDGIDFMLAKDFTDEQWDGEKFGEKWTHSVFSNFPNTMYAVIVTITSLGYGTPEVATTMPGQAITIFLAFAGIVTESLLTSTIINALTLSVWDRRLSNWLTISQSEKKIESIAAKIIARAWRYKKARKNILKGHTERNNFVADKNKAYINYKRGVTPMLKKMRYYMKIITRSLEELEDVTGLGNSTKFKDLNLAGIFCHIDTKPIRMSSKLRFNIQRRHQVDKLKEIKNILEQYTAKMENPLNELS